MNYSKFYPRIQKFASLNGFSFSQALAAFREGFEVELEHKKTFIKHGVTDIRGAIADTVFDHFEEFGKNFLLYYPELKAMEERIKSGAEKSQLNKVLWYTYSLNGAPVNIYLVNGEFVRNDIDVEFIEGAHRQAREDLNFIPEHEIWIEQNLDLKDRYAVAVHETYENYLMVNKDMEYEEAHQIADDREREFRKLIHVITNPSEIAELFEKLVNFDDAV